MKKAFWLLGLLISVALFVGCSNDDKGNNNDGTLGLPSVPNATGGELTPRPAAPNVAVTANNLHDFAEAFSMMMISGGYFSPEQNSANRTKSVNANRRARAAAANSNRTARSSWQTYSDSGIDTLTGYHTGRRLSHYTINGRYREINNGEEWNGNGTDIIQFFDFSHDGRLFLGKSIGIAHTASGFYNDETGSESGTGELKINGTIEFNGVFQGSLTYNNVHIKATFTYNYITDYDDIKFEVLGGSLTAGSIDVDIARYLEFALFFMDFF